MTTIESAAASAKELLNSVIPLWYPAAKKEGDLWKMGNAAGEAGDSLAIYPDGGWKDFASGETGSDLVALRSKTLGCRQIEAACAILGIPYAAGIDPKAWKPTNKPAPQNAPAPTFRHGKWGNATHTWEYKNKDGQTCFHVARYNDPETGKKQVVSISYCENGDQRAWRQKAWTGARTLYRLDKMQPTGPVLIVEGEKAADAAARLLQGTQGREEALGTISVISWAGGGQAIKKTDWAPLKGREIIFWRDEDQQVYPENAGPGLHNTLKPLQLQPGQMAMTGIREILSKICPSFKMITAPEGVCDGWDAADAEADGMTPDEALALLYQAAPWSATRPPATGTALDPKTLGKDKPKGKPANTPNLSEDTSFAMAAPFQVLGQNGKEYFYLSHRTGSIVALTPPAHTANNLVMLLAVRQLWELHFPGKKPGTVAWEDAASYLGDVASSLPFFDAEKIRGRGCWVDGGAAIYNDGEEIVRGPFAIPIADFVSPDGFIYQNAAQRPVVSTGLNDEDATKVATYFKGLHWADKSHAVLIAGWAAIAPICGAMHWRPHAMVTGPSGAGKSTWVITPIRGLVGGLEVEADSTAAGIRNKLNSDAFPVIWDEFEAKDSGGIERIQQVFNLARTASCDASGSVIKGTQQGGSASYQVKASFLYSTIAPTMKDAADRNRVSLVELKKYTSGMTAGDKGMNLTLSNNQDFQQEFRARMIQNAYTIRQNGMTFSAVLTSITSTPRDADQLGVLIAGYHALHSTELLDACTAAAFLVAHGLSNIAGASVDAPSDEESLVQHLFGAHIKTATGQTTTVGELLGIITECTNPDEIHLPITELARHGLKVENLHGVPQLWVANQHVALEGLFKGTDFTGGRWAACLKRIEGASQNLINTGKPGVVRFGKGVISRATRIPFTL